MVYRMNKPYEAAVSDGSRANFGALSKLLFLDGAPCDQTVPDRGFVRVLAGFSNPRLPVTSFNGSQPTVAVTEFTAMRSQLSHHSIQRQRWRQPASANCGIRFSNNKNQHQHQHRPEKKKTLLRLVVLCFCCSISGPALK